MFLNIFKFEIKYWFKNFSFYIYSITFLLLSVMTIAGLSGVFGEDSIPAGSFSNSPMSLFSLFNFFNKLSLFLLPAIIGSSVYKDYISNVHNVLYSYPFTKRDYFLGKFLSSFLIVCLVTSMIGIGFIIGTNLPGINNAAVLPFEPEVYLKIYSLYILPNLIFSGVMVFAVTIFTRNIYAGFITVLVLLIVRESLFKIAAGATGISGLFALSDPFGEAATYYYTLKNANINQNTSDIPFGELIIFNRIIWITVSAFIFGIVYKWFTFTQNAVTFNFKKSKPELVSGKSNEGSIIKIDLPKVKLNFSIINQLRISWKLSAIDFKYIVSSGSFISILFAGLMFVFIALFQMNLPYGTRLLPVTWTMLGFPMFIYSLLIIVMTFLYAGILIRRSKSASIQDLTDVTPVNNFTLLLSKFLALIKIQILLLSIIMIAGIIVQTYKGYYNFEISHYLFALFVIHLTGYIIWAFASLLIQTIFDNSYLGLFILIICAVGISELPQIGIEQMIFRFNQNPEPDFFLKYSDLSGYGHSLIPFFIYKSYWLIFGLLLFTTTLFFWNRGMTQSFKERLVIVKSRFKGISAVFFILILIVFVSEGLWISNEKKSSGELISDNEITDIKKNSDLKYKVLTNTVQPRIVSVNVNMNIFPETRNFNSDGEYLMVNKSNKIIDTILISSAFDVITEYQFDKTSVVINKDSIARFEILKLPGGLKPGDSLKMKFKVRNIPNTLFSKNSAVESNGSFITSIIYPEVGYRTDNSEKSPLDSFALRNHYRSFDSDYIDFETTVSTSSDQIAIAPGYLQKEWAENGRKFYIYKSTNKVTNDFVFNSGQFEIKKDKWKDISLEIYYNKGHEFNLEHLMEGMKAALEYNEKFFGPYQHKQARIIEYSRSQGDFAQSFANTIPLSEISFIMDINDDNENELNLLYLGAAHELSHQWWGHQVIPADVAGIRMITESMSEYVSMKVLEQKYGRYKTYLFLKKAMDIYLKKRSGYNKTEKPLMYNSGLEKSYIPYQKGSIVFNAMSNYIGEENLNNAIKKFYEKVKYQNQPYTNTIEMVDFIRQETPDSLQYLIKDLFETVTFYENRIVKIDKEKLPDGRYKVDIEYIISKYRIDENGFKIYEDSPGEKLSLNSYESDDNIYSLPLSEYTEIGIFSDNNLKNRYPENSIYLKKHKSDQIENKVSVIVNEEPFEVCIDPFLNLIDSDYDDNRKLF